MYMLMAGRISQLSISVRLWLSSNERNTGRNQKWSVFSKFCTGFHQRLVLVMDVCSLAFPPATFDLIIDKATFDAVASSLNNHEKIAKMLQVNAVPLFTWDAKGIHALLKPNGTYICITHGKPASRLPYLSQGSFDWVIDSTQLSTVLTRLHLKGFREEEGGHIWWSWRFGGVLRLLMHKIDLKVVSSRWLTTFYYDDNLI